MTCIVPGCEQPEQYVTTIDGGWSMLGMCAVHRERERCTLLQIEWEHAWQLEQYDPVGAAVRRERSEQQAREERARLIPPIDPLKWGDPDGSRYGLRALESLIGDLRDAAAAGSGRNDAFSNAAYRLGQLVAGGELREDVAREALQFCVDAAANGPREVREFMTVINRRLAKGMEVPRSAPERRAAA